MISQSKEYKDPTEIPTTGKPTSVLSGLKLPPGPHWSGEKDLEGDLLSPKMLWDITMETGLDLGGNWPL